MKENEGPDEMTTLSVYPYLLHGPQALPNCKQISVGRPGDKSHRTPSPHPTTTVFFLFVFFCLFVFFLSNRAR